MSDDGNRGGGSYQSRSRFRITLRAKRKLLAAVLFAPTVCLILVFVYGFIGFTARISITKSYTPYAPNLSVTKHLLHNYYGLATNPRFQDDIRNVIIFTILVLFGANVVGLILAVLINGAAKAAGFFRSIFLLPYAVSGIVTGIVWRWLFDPTTGVNVLLKVSGISALYQHVTGAPLQPGWITDPSVVGTVNGVLTSAFPSVSNFLFTELGIPMAILPVVIASTWQLSGFAMALYLAGLAGIPKEVMEAGEIDGASGIQAFRYITVPLLRPTFVVSLVLVGQLALKSFDLIYSMVGTGPGFATDVPSIFVYDQMFRALNYNSGSAAAIVMLLLVALVVVPYLWRTYARGDL